MERNLRVIRIRAIECIVWPIFIFIFEERSTKVCLNYIIL